MMIIIKKNVLKPILAFTQFLGSEMAEPFPSFSLTGAKPYQTLVKSWLHCCLIASCFER